MSILFNTFLNYIKVKNSPMKSLTSDQYVVTNLEEIKKNEYFYRQIFVKIYTKMYKFVNISDFLIWMFML